MQVNKNDIILIIVLFVIAIVRFYFFIPIKPDFDFAIGEEVEVVGVISDYPDTRIKNERLVISIEESKTKLLIITSSVGEFSYGDKILVKGILDTPKNFTTSSGKEFNYERYLANKDIYFLIKNADIKLISKENGNKIKSILFKIRNIFSQSINKIISSPESDLGRGLILGDRGGFDGEMQEDFIKTGTIHIVALSGYNITIVSNAVIKIFSLFLSTVLSIVLGIFFILLFILMAGGGATIVRAGIMAFIALYARITGRNYFAGRALVVAGLVMFAYDPRVVTDMSFQLSFLATFGILFITPKVLNWFSFVTMRFGFRENLSTTISATIAVLPILLYSTGILSIVSIPTNILVLPLIPFAMLFTFLSGVFRIVSVFIAIPFGFVAENTLALILFLINKSASFSFASVSFVSFPLFLTIILYGLILYWAFKLNKTS
jgi:competence protein ComEC